MCSTDKVCENIQLEKMKIGDVLYFSNMGAYTYVLRTPFNSFPTTSIRHYIHENDL